MDRPAVLELMVKLKLRGMRAAYDEVITRAAKRHHSPEQVVGALLAAQLADVESRATTYRLERFRFRRNHTKERALRCKSSTGSVKVGIALEHLVARLQALL